MITMPKWVIALLLLPAVLVVVLVGYVLHSADREDQDDDAEIRRLQRALAEQRDIADQLGYDVCLNRVRGERLAHQLDPLLKGFVNERLGYTREELEERFVNAILEGDLDGEIPAGTGKGKCEPPES